MNLFALIHAYPEFLILDLIPKLTALSRSASSKTINGSFPPSSNTTRFKFQPDISAIVLPAYVLPVKLTPLILGFDITNSVSSWEAHAT